MQLKYHVIFFAFTATAVVRSVKHDGNRIIILVLVA